MKLTEQIDNLCKKHNLCEEVKKDILELCKASYFEGSNDCHEAYYKSNKEVIDTFPPMTIEVLVSNVAVRVSKGVIRVEPNLEAEHKVFRRGDSPEDFLENLMK